MARSAGLVPGIRSLITISCSLAPTPYRYKEQAWHR